MQPFTHRFLVLAVTLISVAMVFLGCSEEDATPSTVVNIALSDAPIPALAEAVITIDRVTINRPGDDIVVDEFPNPDPDGEPLDTVTIDLLDYQGTDFIVLVEGLELEVGSYQNMRLEVIDEDTDFSWVVEEGDDTRKELKVPSDELKLGGFEVEDVGVQTFVIEVPLETAMTYNPGPPGPDRYILKPRGIRILDVAAAVTIQGLVDFDAIGLVSPCDEKPATEVGNVVYLYPGLGLDVDTLGDQFDPDLPGAPDGIIVPYASEGVNEETGEYAFTFIPAGSYTVALACDAEGDDPDVWDEIVIPLPDGEICEVTLAAGEQATCNFPLDIRG